MSLEDLDGVLPAGVSREAGPPPAPPVDYDEGYVLPAHSEKPLQRLHTHPLDARLRFYEEPHIYTFDGVPTTISVTGLAHAYDSPFEPKAAIAAMKGSRRQAWPRLEYVHGARPLRLEAWTPAEGALRVVGGRTVAVAPPHSLHAGATAADLLEVLAATRVPGGGEAGDARKRGRDDCPEEGELHAYARAMTDAEIEAAWALNGRVASHKGTEAHYGAELCFNGLPYRWWEPDMRVLIDFCRSHLLPRGIVGHNTEKEIVCADADVAGSIDLIVWDPGAKLHHIIDHKRSDKLQMALRGYGKMRAPFSHLDDCKGAGYALQTSIYQYILERDYGLDIGERVLLSLHGDRPFSTAVPYLKAEAAYIIENRVALVAARRAVAAEDPARFRCALTGAPAVDAVRLDDGRVAMEKAAVVGGLAHAADAPTRAAFEEAVGARLVEVPLARADCLPWRKRMPEAGLPPFA